MATAILIAMLDEDPEHDLASGPGGEAVLDTGQIAGDHGEQIRRLRKRVLPAGEMPAAFTIADLDQIAVRQQHRISRFVGPDRRGVDRHHVRAIRKIGDPAETLGLTLGAVHPVGKIKSLQCGVFSRVVPAFHRQDEDIGHRGNAERLSPKGIVIDPQGLAVQGDLQQFLILTVEV